MGREKITSKCHKKNFSIEINKLDRTQHIPELV